MSAPEHPSAVLRRAAAKLRGQAEAAKELTGDGNGEWFPWGTVKQTEWRPFPGPRAVPRPPYPFGDGSPEMAEGEHAPTGEAFVAHSRYAHDQHEDWHEPEFFAGPMPEKLAVYIAAVHPGVALALAEWLEVTAKRLESGMDTVLSRLWCGACGHAYGDRCHCWDSAVAVAAAVLGESEAP